VQPSGTLTPPKRISSRASAPRRVEHLNQVTLMAVVSLSRGIREKVESEC
jgi:hypothetical protein